LIAGGAAMVLPAVIMGLVGLMIGAMFLHGDDPSGGGSNQPDAAQNNTPAQPDAASQPPPAPAPPPPAAPSQTDPASYLQQIDLLIQKTQQARSQQEASDFYNQLTQQLYRMQTTMQQDQADAAKQQEYGEFSKRYVLVSQARDALQKQFSLPPAR